MSSPLVIINPSDRDWTHHRYVLSFGAHAPTHLMVYANALDDALEECGEWLAKHAPGLIIAHGSHELTQLFSEAVADIPDGDDCSPAWEQATADLTYTKAGYITSYEWFITLEDPTRAEIKAFIAELAARHYSDEPVVKVA